MGSTSMATMAMGGTPTGTPVSNTNMMPMSSMAMTFFFSNTTPLFSMSWMPSDTSNYAVTCIFLVILGTIFRGLITRRALLLQAYHSKAQRRRTPLPSAAKTVLLDSASDGSTDTPRWLDRNGGERPWRISEDLPRATLDVLIAGVGYLLMIAVMTMNVGYFLSVLAGIFIGSLTLGHLPQG